MSSPLEDLFAVANEVVPYISNTAATLNRSDEAKKLTERLQAAIAAFHVHMENNVRNHGEKLELHIYPDREMSTYDQLFLDAAYNMGSDGDLEFDEVSVISQSDDAGEYVLGWKWIPNESVTFPRRFHANVYYLDEAQAKHLIATDDLMALDQPTAEKLLLDKHWDSRLDAASCGPHVEWIEHELTKFDVTVYDKNDDDEFVDLQTEQVAIADVRPALAELYPEDDFNIVIAGEPEES